MRRLELGGARRGAGLPRGATWNPLQIPSTGPPSGANAITHSMIGEKRAIAPTRR